MRIFLGGVFTAGFQIISTSYFQATGQPLKASILSMLRQFFLLVPLTLIMPLYYGCMESFMPDLLLISFPPWSSSCLYGKKLNDLTHEPNNRDY